MNDDKLNLHHLNEFIEHIKNNNIDKAVDYLLNDSKTKDKYIFNIDSFVRYIMDLKMNQRYIYLAVLTSIFRKDIFLTPKEIFLELMNCCKKSKNREVKFNRNSCLIMCFSALFRSDRLKGNNNDLSMMLKKVFRIGFAEQPIRLGSYEIIFDAIIRHNYTIGEINEQLMPIFQGKYIPTEPDDLDTLYLLYRLSTMFPSIKINIKIKKLTTVESLKHFLNVFKQSITDYKKMLHPIWKLLGQSQNKDYLNNIYTVFSDEIVLLSHAYSGILLNFNEDQFIEFLSNKDLFFKFYRNHHFRSSIQTKLDECSTKMYEVLVNLIMLERQKEFSNKKDKFSPTKFDKINYKDILNLINKFSTSFFVLEDILKAQKDRKDITIEEFSSIFTKVCEHLSREDDFLKISKFISSLICKTNHDGQDYMTYLFGEPVPFPDAINSLDDSIRSINLINKYFIDKGIYRLLKVQPFKECKDAQSFVDLLKEISVSKAPFMEKSTTQIIRQSINILPVELSSIFEYYLSAVVDALSNKQLRFYVSKIIIDKYSEIPMFSKKLLNSLQPEHVKLTEKESFELLKHILTKDSFEKSEINLKIITTAVQNTSTDSKNIILDIKLKELLENKSLKSTIYDILHDIIKNEQSLAKAVIDFVINNRDSINAMDRNALKFFRTSIPLASEFASKEEIVDAMLAVVERDYSSSKKDKFILDCNVRFVYHTVKTIPGLDASKFAFLHPITMESKSTLLYKLMHEILLTNKADEQGDNDNNEEDDYSEEEDA